jgi:hypothetical protein
LKVSKIFKKKYRGADLHHLFSDVDDALDKVEVDKYGFAVGKFVVTIKWTPPKEVKGE